MDNENDMNRHAKSTTSASRRSSNSSSTPLRKLLHENVIAGLLNKATESSKAQLPDSVDLNVGAIQIKEEPPPAKRRKNAPPKLDDGKEYCTHEIARFSAVWKVLQTLGFSYNIGFYRHPDIINDFDCVWDLRAFFCRYGIPNIGLIKDDNTRQMVENWACFAHVDAIALTNARMGLRDLSHEILPSAKIVPLLCSVFGFQMTPSGCFWAPGANYIPREQWVENIHYFNHLKDVQAYVRSRDVLEVEQTGRATTRKNRTQVDDGALLSLRLWAAVCKEPLPTFVPGRRVSYGNHQDDSKPSPVASGSDRAESLAPRKHPVNGADVRARKQAQRKRPPSNTLISPFPDHVSSCLLETQNVARAATTDTNDNNTSYNPSRHPPVGDSAFLAISKIAEKGKSKAAGSAVLEVDNRPFVLPVKRGPTPARQPPVDTTSTKETTILGKDDTNNDIPGVRVPTAEYRTTMTKSGREATESSRKSTEPSESEKRTPEEMYSLLAKDIEVHRRLRDHMRKAVGLPQPGRQEHAISATVPANLTRDDLREENKRLGRILRGLHFEISELEKM